MFFVSNEWKIRMSEILTLRFLECKRASLYNDFGVRYSVAKEAGTMNIGEQIKARRIEIGMTQQDIADRLAVSRSAISNWETGKNYPDLQIIVQISEELNISLDALLKGDTNVVEKIANDTNESKKLREKAKQLKGVIAVLAVLLIGVVYLFFGWSAEISKPEQVKKMKIENDQLVIEVDTPNYYGQRDWWIDIDDTGTIAQVTICYGFGKNRKDNNIMRTPVNTDDYSDSLSREHMAKLEKIQIITTKGKVVKELDVTN